MAHLICCFTLLLQGPLGPETHDEYRCTIHAPRAAAVVVYLATQPSTQGVMNNNSCGTPRYMVKETRRDGQNTCINAVEISVLYHLHILSIFRKWDSSSA